MTTLTDIEKQARMYADKRQILRDRVEAFEAEIDSIKRKHYKGIRAGQIAASQAEDRLGISIDAAPELFIKPKTHNLHGIRCGMQMGKGKIEIADKAKTCTLIRKHFSDQAEVLIKTTEAPIAKALDQLTSAELKRIGVTVIPGKESVYIKPADSALDKLVEALMKEAREKDAAAA
ncbi:MAG: hypothetical protein RPT95_10440 [Candidatus Sedimenticola sp. (ex Thyasira tokunagai)]